MRPPPARLVIWLLTYPETKWRRALPKLSRERRLALFDWYYDLAEQNKADGGSCYEDLFDFAWRLNDLVAEYHSDIRNPKKLRTPIHAAALRRARQGGRVPQPVDGAHVEIGFAFGYRAGSRCAFIAIRRDEDDPYTMDFRFLSGLDVRILATAADFRHIDPLARRLAYHGARSVTMRRLDFKCADEVLYKGYQQWWR